MSTALAPGFADPVIDAQRSFRAVMEALARPGAVQPLPVELRPPAPLTRELAAVALALADHDAPLWLDAPLRDQPAVAAFLRFHTGARIVAEPEDAAFALIVDPAAAPACDRFALGSADYPDRSATLVTAVRRLDRAGANDAVTLTLRGPGIETEKQLHVSGLPADFIAQRAANHALFPRGVDHLLVAPGAVAGLPRTTSVTEG